MLGFYENFPANIHHTDIFTSALSRQKLQRRLALLLAEINQKKFSFEEVGNPTVPGGTVILEFGIADTSGFNFVDKEEAQKVLYAVAQEPLRVMDLFCAIRYYKNKEGKQKPLKFDYYMMRMAFGQESTVEFQVFHERGPRYISPEDLVGFLLRKVNETSNRKILKPAEPI
jgi:hypothetical protein